MKFLGIAVAVNMVFAGTAFASDMCSVPTAEWQPRPALEAKLKAEGWAVRSIQIEDGCYEAYAVDAKGKKVEAYFNPKSFEVVKVKSED
ncbi:PepSY domain-containing protein [Rhizobiaceae bacterium n13]|uniref:PepSY domain-containing protein n=1 Tax=Ferirhizobium litorale TaxID=2927786 RepID=A0AAE3U1S6_9HYPH|nr:PepSY domain-containing protein [Fererhizobium litorale]MDI7861686.1 PepSY domain-containing protein [Fererhizobium litorale]MDI7921972.1 PepSY domain-containing protein [Fererhizobium litorale]